jgi:3D (Asp-Asp-Asp) domain-containing protein
MMKSLFGGSAAIATVLITASVLFYARPLAAEPHSTTQHTVQQQEPVQEQKKDITLPAALPDALLASDTAIAIPTFDSVPATVKVAVEAPPALPSKPVKAAEMAASASQNYVATAYSLSGRTATGRQVSKGLIAADPRFLPFGTRVRLDAGTYSGEYIVADAGSAVKGRKIDVWVPTSREARRFGRRNIRLTVLSYGVRKKASRKKAG